MYDADGVFDGETLHHDYALVVEAGVVESVCPRAEISQSATRVTLNGILAPGYVDHR